MAELRVKRPRHFWLAIAIGASVGRSSGLADRFWQRSLRYPCRIFLHALSFYGFGDLTAIRLLDDNQVS